MFDIQEQPGEGLPRRPRRKALTTRPAGRGATDQQAVPVSDYQYIMSNISQLHSRHISDFDMFALGFKKKAIN